MAGERPNEVSARRRGRQTRGRRAECQIGAADFSSAARFGILHRKHRGSEGSHPTVQSTMMETMRSRSFRIFLLASLCLLLVMPVLAQEQEKSEPEAKKEESDTARLHVKVTGGEGKKPVEGASVYVRFFEERRLAKDKRREMNLKTAPDGEVRVPPVPKGKILIQIVAPGWRTYGKWYDIEKDQETIEIHLERPRRWY